MPVIVENVPRGETHIYLMCFRGRPNEYFGPIKIGITSHLSARLASVQTGQHQKIHVLASFPAPNREIARERETEFHKEFADHRLEGEWFDVDPIVGLERLCQIWRWYFQKLPEGIEMVGIPFYEREIKAMRCWREYYAEHSNVRSIA